MTFAKQIAGAAALGVVMLLAAVSPTRANLISDPGFESCTTAGSAPPPGWTGSAFCGLTPHSGMWSANFNSGSFTLSQSIATTAGDKYDFSFWLITIGPAIPNSFTASFSRRAGMPLGLSTMFR
jgi:hypothetical protein